MVCYILELDKQIVRQDEACSSFIGGMPKLPEELQIPVCGLCGAQQTFFFQVAFPLGHCWQGLSLAVFACTMCVEADFLIPRMLQGPLHNADIPQGFLDSYQVNFRLLVFDTSVARIRSEYAEKVAFKRWLLVPTRKPRSQNNKIGCEPNWLLEDESPGTYASRVPMFFLMQLVQDFRFDTVPGASPQAQLYPVPGVPTRPYYKLFNGNALYFFGTQERDKPLVYLITQTD